MLISTNASDRAPWDSHWAGYDGYDMMEIAAEHGWKANPGWARDGYDLGSWPYVVIYTRQGPTADYPFELAQYVEGDVRLEAFATGEERDTRIDEIAFWYWKHNEEDWVEGIERAQDLPAHLRGPVRPEEWKSAS